MPKATKTKSSKESPKLDISAKISGAEDFEQWCKEHKKHSKSSSGAGGALYFVGFIGALIYWSQAATNFGGYLTGLLKALVWPAYIVYKLLESFYGVVL